jgi:AcrR family transcriptional regulator
MSRGTDIMEETPARERILRAAVDIIAAEGEAALRLADVAAAAGVALSLTTHYFRTRDHLVAEALAERFAGLVRDDLRRIARLVREGDGGAFREGLTRLTADVLDRRRATQRLARIAAVGGAHGRPDLAQRLGDETAALLDELAVVIRSAQESGLVRADLDPRALATFLQAYSLGMVVADLDARPSDRADVQAVIDVFMGCVQA